MEESGEADERHHGCNLVQEEEGYYVCGGSVAEARSVGLQKCGEAGDHTVDTSGL